MKSMKYRMTMGLCLLAVPALLRAASVSVAWDANMEPDLAGYRLYYANGSLLSMTTVQAMAAPNVTKLTSSGAGTSIVVGNLAEGTTYYFRLTAFDSSGEESDFGTAPLEISTCVPTTPPSAPSGLTAAPMTPTRIDLAWSYPGGAPTGFTVEWSLDGGSSWTVIANLGGAARSYQSAVLTSVPYRYRVKAVKTGWPDSGYATTGAVMTTPNTTPSSSPAAAVEEKLLTPGRADGVNDEVDFGANAVDVRVVDARGRTVFQGHSTSGGILWNGRNDRGVPMPTGLYIGKVTDRNGGVRHEKILVVK